MVILLYLVAILAFFWAVGFATTVVLQAALPISFCRIRGIRFTLPAIGYAVSCVGWWGGTFILKLHNATVLLAGGALLALALGILIKNKFSRRLVLPLLPCKSDWPAFIVVLSVIGIAAWPYVVAGMGNYFLYNDTDWFNRVTPSILHHKNVVDVLNTIVREPYPGWGSNIENVRDFPLELSNLMLLQAVFGLSSNDSAMMQSVANLIFVALGTYWLSRYIFNLRGALPALAAFLAVVAQFFFHTYLDGHIGSTMYTSAAPYLFGSSTWALARDRYRTTIPLITIFGIFMWKAYAIVLILLILPLIAAKLGLLYLDKEKTINAALNSWLGKRLSPGILRLLVVVVAITLLTTLYGAAHAFFYPNRVAALLMGYDPMYIVFSPQVLEWFYGLRLTEGFGYGFISQTVDLHYYDIFATFVAALLTIGIAFGCWRLLRNRLGTFLAVFLVTLPIGTIAFSSLLPFTYVIYKLMHVHYFLVVIGAVFGFYYLIRQAAQRRWIPAVAVLSCIVGITVAVNVFGTLMNTATSQHRISLLDPTDLGTLIRRIKQARMHNVGAHVDGSNLAAGLIRYSLADSDIGMDSDEKVGYPVITPQHLVFTPVPERDVALSSVAGKYVLANMPNTLIDVWGYQSPEIRNGVVFDWLHTDMDYTSLNLEREFRSLAAFVNSLPGKPLVYNDLSDSGNYELVNAFMTKYGLRHSDDPRECTYFIRMSHHLETEVAQFDSHHDQSQFHSALIGGIHDASGQPKIVRQAFVDNGKQNLRWSGEIFEVVEIPPHGRVLTAPSTINLNSLVAVLNKGRLRVVDQIPAPEYERYFLEDRLRVAGIQIVASPSTGSAILLAAPEFILRKEAAVDPHFRESILWQSRGYSRSVVEGYRILLVLPKVAEQLHAHEVGPFWALHQPLRTIIRPTFNSELLRIRAYRSDRNIQVLVRSGPSRLARRSVIRAMRPDGNAEPLFFTIDSPTQVLNVPVAHFAQPGEISTDIAFEAALQFQQRVMPYDDRLLPYMLLSTEEKRAGAPEYSDRLKQVLRTSITTRSAPDIVDASAFPALALGVGWFDQEEQDGLPFRWMSHHAELVFDSAKTRGRQIVIVGIAGPSAESGHISILASLNGLPVASEDIDSTTQPAEIVIDLGSALCKRALRTGQNVITLSTVNGGQAIAGDPRLLNFRVSHVGIAPDVSSVNPGSSARPADVGRNARSRRLSGKS